VFFEATIDGVAWSALPCTTVQGGSAVSSATAPGAWRVSVAGLSLVRVRLQGPVVGGIFVYGLGTTATQ
jgi:hypothetical protein